MTLNLEELRKRPQFVSTEETVALLDEIQRLRDALEETASLPWSATQAQIDRAVGTARAALGGI